VFIKEKAPSADNGNTSQSNGDTKPNNEQLPPNISSEIASTTNLNSKEVNTTPNEVPTKGPEAMLKEAHDFDIQISPITNHQHSVTTPQIQTVKPQNRQHTIRPTALKPQQLPKTMDAIQVADPSKKSTLTLSVDDYKRRRGLI